VKTAISVPDGIFGRVEAAARRLGISRSEFFARAAEKWVDELEKDEITEKLNELLDATVDDANDEFLRAASARTIQASE